MDRSTDKKGDKAPLKSNAGGNSSAVDENGKEKPDTWSGCCMRKMQCCFKCCTGTIRYCFFCCLPCIDYCCCDTQKCLAKIETCTWGCIGTACFSTFCGPVMECIDLIVLPDLESPWAKSSLEDWGDGGAYDVRMIFWDLDGNLRLGNSLRSRDDEIMAMLKTDLEDTTRADTVWVLIPARWARKWVLFAHLRITDEEPGRIDMFSLMMPDKNESLGWRPKVNLQAPVSDSMDPAEQNVPGHYRRISLQAYQALERLYGVDGFPMAVWGDPYNDYERWRIFSTSMEVERYARDHCPIPEAVVLERAEAEKHASAAATRAEKNANLNANTTDTKSLATTRGTMFGGVTNAFSFGS